MVNPEIVKNPGVPATVVPETLGQAPVAERPKGLGRPIIGQRPGAEAPAIGGAIPVAPVVREIPPLTQTVIK